MKSRSRYNVLVLGLVLSASATAMAQVGTYTPLHSFSFSLDGGNQINPGMLAEGLDGNVYGTTPSQFVAFGTLFEYSPTAAATQNFSRVNFGGNANGAGSNSGVTLGVDGNLYGSTVVGGDANNDGTVFKFTLGGTAPVVIHPFNNSTDGAHPSAPPIQTQDGSLWGVTSDGNPPGVWYKMNTAGSILLQGTAPAPSQAPLYLGGDGNLYGTTQKGGASNDGTVFKLTQAGVLTVLYSFNPGDVYEGLIPVGPVIEGFDGYLYGTTCWGGKTASGMAGSSNTGQGTVFRVARDGSSFSTLHSFQDNVSTLEGHCPDAGLVQGSDGKLYGVTSGGGGGANTNIDGTLFRLNTDGTSFEVVHWFDKSSGWRPFSNLMMDTSGLIYGMTFSGGSLNEGVLFSYNVGLQPFAKLVTPWSGPVGTVINILGQGFNSATGVLIGGVAVPWTKLSHPNIVSDTWMQVTVPAGARTGFVTVVETNANGVSTNLVTRETFTLTAPACNPFVMHCL